MGRQWFLQARMGRQWFLQARMGRQWFLQARMGRQWFLQARMGRQYECRGDVVPRLPSPQNSSSGLKGRLCHGSRFAFAGGKEKLLTNCYYPRRDRSSGTRFCLKSNHASRLFRNDVRYDDADHVAHRIEKTISHSSP